MAFGPYYSSLHVDSGGKRYVHPDDWNAVIDNFLNWKGDVNAANHNLGGVAALTCTTLTVTGSVSETSGVIPIHYWRETDAGSGSRLWKVYADQTAFVFAAANDTDSAESRWLKVSRVGSTATGVVFPTGISVGIGADPVSPLYVFRNGSDEHIRWTNDPTYYYSVGRRGADGYCVLAGNQASPASGFVLSLGGAERFVVTPTFTQVKNLNSYANNTAAAAALPVGSLYMVTGSNPRQIAIVY